jgi:hypothetical protein
MMKFGLSTGTMWRARMIVGLGVVALAVVSGRLVIGDWLGPGRGVEISESALRQGLHRTIAPETAPLAHMLEPAPQTSPISAIRNSACSNGQAYISPFASGHRRPDLSGVKKRAADVLSGRWKDVDITRQGDQAYMAGLSRGERYKVHAFQFLDDLMILLDATGQAEKDRILSYSATTLSDYAKEHFFANNNYRTDNSGDFVWYDMGAGLRASLVGFVLSRAACDSKIPNETIDTLIRFAADRANRWAGPASPCRVPSDPGTRPRMWRHGRRSRPASGRAGTAPSRGRSRQLLPPGTAPCLPA